MADSGVQRCAITTGDQEIKIAPTALKELKIQLQELVDKGFIKDSVVEKELLSSPSPSLNPPFSSFPRTFSFIFLWSAPPPPTLKRKCLSVSCALFLWLIFNRLQEARKLLEKLSERDGGVVHWTSLLTRYTKSGCVNEARMLFEIMPERNIVTYNAMLSSVCAIWDVCLKLANSFEEMPERNAVS
ncbi:pentatricopeptide repeat-containing protein At1g32415, mitochondrial-like [Ziziphus jujuba]|uniref:Pentatricopeptide repeat-containing protein At1g32415, mitochondrial-like n=1 Tax=Ziziphus jujuba TaxID=326968 RepID=A0ABM3ZXC3_ZIZJJ|nr:pentatricopeptide repeat-containing protein At1g32415, mitochondrial-like [Ziziphus jujuba]